jgi:putative nucleotidyltransferase with HDIG domain
MRLGRALNVPENQLGALYYALLLKDIGCSANEARIGDVIAGPTPNHAQPSRLQKLWKQVIADNALLRRGAKALKLEEPLDRDTAIKIVLRCERGANIVRKIGLSTDTSDAIYSLDERWDGSGSPWHLAGTQIPLLARIVGVAQHLDIFAWERTCAVAIEEMCKRSGVWFDPEVVQVARDLDVRGTLWTGCLPSDDGEAIRQLVIDLQPSHSDGIAPETIDRVCEAFADVVDAKSPFTYRHSVGVAEVAAALAQALDLDPDQIQLVRRAALLHDLGKLAVPNSILDKRGALTDEEWRTIMEHPRLTRQILDRIDAFAELAQIAGAHHEKLDGSGYPDHLQAADLGIEARIVAVADSYQAITETRPYRNSLGHAQAYEMLKRMTPHKLDADCVHALRRMKLPQPKWID